VVFNGGRFVGDEPAQEGIYTYTEGRGFQIVANRSTPIPGATGTFTSLDSTPTIDGERVVFWGCGDVPGCDVTPVQEGIYATSSSGLRVVADTHTPVPGGSGNFRQFGSGSTQAGGTTFVGLWGSAGRGVYTSHFSEGLQVVADTQTAVPGGTGNFTGFGTSAIYFSTFDAHHVVFEGKGPGFQSGIYIASLGGNDDGLGVIADTSTILPDHTQPFGVLSTPSVGLENAAFWGCIVEGPPRACGHPGSEGIYSTIGGLHTVADTQTPVPGGTGTFGAFGGPAIARGKVAFTGHGASGAGVYMQTNGTGPLEKIIGPGDLLDGKTVARCTLARNGLGNSALAAAIRFTDGTLALYNARLIDATVGIRGVPNPPQVGQPFGLRMSVRNDGGDFWGTLAFALVVGDEVIPLGHDTALFQANMDFQDVPVGGFFAYPAVPTAGWLFALIDATTGQVVDAAVEIITLADGVSGEEERQIRARADAFLKTMTLPLP
jgi:hypothetical protein